MVVNFDEQGPAIALADLDAFEARVGQRLPPDYRTFLLQHNGGQPEEHVIRDTPAGDVGIQLFFGIWRREFFDIDAENRNMRGRWPDRFLSVAIDDFGNRFLLSLGEPDDGSVYFWNHEEEAEEDEEPTEWNLSLLANSFGRFWERVEPCDPDDYLAEKGFDLDTDPPPTETNGEAT